MSRKKRPDDYWSERWFVKKYGGKSRICANENCSTVLNSYNRNHCCSVHNFAYVVEHKIKIDMGNRS